MTLVRTDPKERQIEKRNPRMFVESAIRTSCMKLVVKSMSAASKNAASTHGVESA